jgi:protocatechuate 3,4-dioxygenase beta subunit
MNRKDFLLKSLSGLGTLAVVPLALACDKTSVEASNNPTTGTTNGSSANDCTVTPSETAGPFPTKNSSNFAIKDIRSDRTGVPMLANITIKNKNTGCTALKDVLVDIWHCDADGNYSQYGGSVSLNFLRGRQTTDANGLASFQTIFPGWYPGRATHIHVAIYTTSGKTLLTSQIAFPASICDTVFTGATNFYKKGKADTTNERDGIFSDGYATELAGVTGSVKDGYTLTHTIVVSA